MQYRKIEKIWRMSLLEMKDQKCATEFNLFFFKLGSGYLAHETTL